ncbi:MAG: LrgB family protein, partial [Muribaculaceae bacterium]|nr:LrgB family protein [Muribaculaceae bacterium]
MTAIIDILHNPLSLITLTFLIYWGAGWVQRVSRQAWLSPMLITIAALIALLRLTGMSYESYYE